MEQELKEELDLARTELAVRRAELESVKLSAAREAQLRQQAEAQAKSAYEDLAAAWSLAEEFEARLLTEQARFQQQLTAVQAVAVAAPAAEMASLLQNARSAGEDLDLDGPTPAADRPATRDAGWEADVEVLRFARACGRRRAGTWPLPSGPPNGPATTPVRRPEDRGGRRGQAEAQGRGGARAGEAVQPRLPIKGDEQPPRRSLGRTGCRSCSPPTAARSCASSGTRAASGSSTRGGHEPPAAAGGLVHARGPPASLAQNIDEARKLKRDRAHGYLPLRDYQLGAIERSRRALRRAARVPRRHGDGHRQDAHLHRPGLSAAQDASAFAACCSSSTATRSATRPPMRSRTFGSRTSKTFADIFDVKELGDLEPEPDTRLHIATVQAMVKRVLYPDDERAALPVDRYDCIVVDECHRGYLLDRELSDGEMRFRDEADYISKYRRVLDHFDAVKIGLTATPALHTTEIFGTPVFQYSYREAVIDGCLVDHEPPIRIVTKLARRRHPLAAGRGDRVLNTRTDQIQLIQHARRGALRRRASSTARSSPRTSTGSSARALAEHIDPPAGKTIIFCVTDRTPTWSCGCSRRRFGERTAQVEDER